MTTGGARYWDGGAIPLIAPGILGDIIAEVADLGIVIAPDGKILSLMVNPDNKAFGDLVHWEGRDIRATLTMESKKKFDKRLEGFLSGESTIRALELNHADDDAQWEFPIRYSLHNIGPDGAILMIGSDLRPIADMQQQLVKAQLALERDYEAQREVDTRLRVLMEAIDDAVVFVSAKSGEITQANPSACGLLGVDHRALVGQKLSDFFDDQQPGDLLDSLTAQATSENGGTSRVALQSGEGQVTIKPTLFRAAGERIMLCRIAPTGTNSAKSSDLASNMQDLFAGAPDAIVFATHTGALLSANDAFLDMIDAANDTALRNSSLSDYFHRGSVDFKVMVENAARTGRMRLYHTKIASEYGSPRSVEISVTRINAEDNAIYAFVLRDASQSDAARATTHPASDESMRSVVELVGNANLRDIVAETTNVVEKMCIETAVKLTMNNRVAAAEMLGLSRQSLYVKLRKFGLLNRETQDD